MDRHALACGRLTESNAREAFEAAARRDVAELAGDTLRGIVIPAGGPRYLPGAYVAATMLTAAGVRVADRALAHGQRGGARCFS